MGDDVKVSFGVLIIFKVTAHAAEAIEQFQGLRNTQDAERYLDAH
ncbi:MAG TPA: hypothetical protein VGH55_01560 [Chthoniobacterales bacterium]